jgi:hypothetical protein
VSLGEAGGGNMAHISCNLAHSLASCRLQPASCASRSGRLLLQASVYIGFYRDGVVSSNADRATDSR